MGRRSIQLKRRNQKIQIPTLKRLIFFACFIWSDEKLHLNRRWFLLVLVSSMGLDLYNEKTYRVGQMYSWVYVHNFGPF